jgi:hypothetical protein
LSVRGSFRSGGTLSGVNRRTYLATLAAAGGAATAGCSALERETLSEPTVSSDGPGRGVIGFEADGSDVGHLGVDGTVDGDRIDLSTEIWHREGTRVESVTLELSMPPTDATAEVAVVSPVEGDSSPPPELSLYTPEDRQGTAVEITDLDDLADETISTLDLVVRPGPETDPVLFVHATIELASAGVLSGGYTLDGEIELEYPGLDGR